MQPNFIYEIEHYDNFKFWYFYEIFFTHCYGLSFLIIKDVLEFWEMVDEDVFNEEMLAGLSKKEIKKKARKAARKMKFLNKINLIAQIKSALHINKQDSFSNIAGLEKKISLELYNSQLYEMGSNVWFDFLSSRIINTPTMVIIPQLRLYLGTVVKLKHMFKIMFYINRCAAENTSNKFVSKKWYFNKIMFDRKYFNSLYPIDPKSPKVHRIFSHVTYPYKTYPNYSNKLYSNKLYSNKWLIKLHGKVLFYTTPYNFCEPFLFSITNMLNKRFRNQSAQLTSKMQNSLIVKSYTLKNLEKFLSIIGEKHKQFNYYRSPTTFRLKPGYSKLWRRARYTLRKLYRIKSEFQHLLTRHLNRSYKYSAAHRILLNHYELENVIISTSLARNKLHVREMLQSGLILINYVGVPLKCKYHVYTGDLIQLSVNWWIYFYLIVNFSYTPKQTLKYIRKWNFEINKVFRKPRKKILFKIYHQLHSAVSDAYKDNNKFLNMFETDYSLCWLYTLFEPQYWWETNPLSLLHEPFFDSKVYNWKYITEHNRT